MSYIIKDNNLNKKSQMFSKFEIKNGLVGVNRDIFLLLLSYMCFENAVQKTRNVRELLFFFLLCERDVYIFLCEVEIPYGK
jgi:hypothetical protein